MILRANDLLSEDNHKELWSKFCKLNIPIQWNILIFNLLLINLDDTKIKNLFSDWKSEKHMYGIYFMGNQIGSLLNKNHTKWVSGELTEIEKRLFVLARSLLKTERDEFDLNTSHPDAVDRMNNRKDVSHKNDLDSSKVLIRSYLENNIVYISPKEIVIEGKPSAVTKMCNQIMELSCGVGDGSSVRSGGEALAQPLEGFIDKILPEKFKSLMQAMIKSNKLTGFYTEVGGTYRAKLSVAFKPLHTDLIVKFAEQNHVDIRKVAVKGKDSFKIYFAPTQG